MLEADLTTHLHGLVNVYDGARHILECLIVASEVENGQLVCSFKRSTLVENKAPLDYFEPRERGVALLPKF
jgi:SUMO ligase MMS21 Smc5/6 complex component